ncbi:MAG: OmpA family protein [Alphaproteobacteria bacterium]|nr:OmpA family protein [Alphaproteobacteria bacterium]
MKKIFVSIFSVLLLAGCARENAWDVEKVRAMPVAGDSVFYDQLKYEYTELAAAERSEGDWDDTVVFLERAKDAAVGEMTVPDPEALGGIDEKWLPEAHAGRIRLKKALDGNATKKKPREAALALAGFECWLKELEENRYNEDIAACRAQFETAMSVIENFGCGPNRFITYFDFDKAKLTEEAKRIVDNSVVYFNRISQGRKSLIVISGHADTMGSKSYNKGLSKRRAETVKAYLSSKGVNVSKVKVEFFGETKPAVLTPDETMEPRNRRATVDVR